MKQLTYKTNAQLYILTKESNSWIAVLGRNGEPKEDNYKINKKYTI